MALLESLVPFRKTASHLVMHGLFGVGMPDALIENKRSVQTSTAIRQNGAGSVETNNEISALQRAVRNTALKSVVAPLQYFLLI